MKNLFAASLMLVAWASLSLEAAVLRVPGEYPSIQEAIDGSDHGDTVLVSPGLYYERINFNGKNITVTSTDPNNSAVVGYTILNAQGEGPVVTFENGEYQATLAGFTLTGGVGQLQSYSSEDDKYYYGAGIYCRYGSPTITRNVIVNNVSPYAQEEVIERVGNTTYYYYRYDWSYGGGIYYAGSGDITYNTIYNNSAYRGGGICCEGSAHIANNLIYNNSSRYAGGVLMYYGRLTNNTIVNNNTDLDPENGYGGNVYANFPEDPTNLVISNNIITGAGSGGGVYLYGDPGEAFRHNDVWGNAPVDYVMYDRSNSTRLYGGEADRTGLFGNISEDPMLMTTWNRRFHIDPESPCVSAGDPNHVPRTSNETDIDGDPRIYGLIVDIGADEHIGYVKPLANAGPDVHVLGLEQVDLDGTSSYFSDPDGVTTYQWSQILGSTVDTTDPTGSTLSFTPNEEGWYKFELIVADGQYTSGPDTVLVVVGNEAPIAVAGRDALAESPGYVVLDGSGSSDADPPDELSYTWTQIEGPAVMLSDPNVAQPWFLSEESGIRVFELVVNDGFVDSVPDRVKVEATPFVIEAEDFTASQRPEDSYQYYFYPAVSGTGVAYVGGDYTPSRWQVYWTDTKTGTSVTFDAGNIDTKPRVDGDIVVWMGGSGDYYEPIRTSIYMGDVKTGRKTTLQSPERDESCGYPAISGNTVVWARYRDVDLDNPSDYDDRPYDICAADITDPNDPVYFTVVTDAGRGAPYHYNDYTGKGDSPVDIDGHIVVWESEGDIFGADISDLSDIQVFPICTVDEWQSDPAVSGNLVVWRDQRDDQGDIYAADISDRANICEFPVVVESGAQTYPDVDGPLIVYVRGLSGGYLECRCVSREYGVVEFAFPELQDYPYVYDSGLAIDASTIAWSDWDYEVAGARLDFSYAVANGPIANGTTGQRYDYIQHAIVGATDGDVITLPEGTYRQKLRFSGRNVTLTSTNPQNPAVRAATVFTGPGPLVTFADGETRDCLFTGFTVAGGTFGIVSNGSSPTVTHCDITGQVGAGIKLWGGSEALISKCNIMGNGFGVEMWADASSRRSPRNYPTLENCIIAGNRFDGVMGDFPTIKNCTVADNLGYGVSSVKPTIMNSIVYFNNGRRENVVSTQSATITYSDIEGGADGQGNIDQDPEFLAAGLWSPPGDLRAFWTPGDYHIKSQGFSWDTATGAWGSDDVTSPCIDAGDPSLPLGDEFPCNGADEISERAVNGGVNMGAYGQTPQASLAPRN